MKKVILINLLLIIIALQLQSQTPWVRISPNPIESSLKEITQIPGTNRMMAIGTGASILYTDDMGENWHVKYKPAGISRFITFNAIHFVDSNLGFLAGTKSTLLKTLDGGMTWQDVSPQGDKDLFDVYFHDELHGTITKYSTVMKTEDACQTWDSTFSGTHTWPKHLHYIDDSVGFFTNNNADYFYKTINGGEIWDSISISPAIYDFTISDIHFLNKEIGFISGDAGSYKYILKTIDGGGLWSQVYMDPFNFTHDIYFHNSDTGFAVGPRIMYDNDILMTTDGGENWQECEMPYSSWNLNSIVFSDGGVGLCVGDHGQIFSSYDWGNNWIKTDDHLTILRSIKDTQVIDDSIVYIGGISYANIQGCVYKSTDSGLSWNKVYDGNAITSICFLNAETGYACGPGLGRIYKTITGGQTWATIEIDDLGFDPDCIYFINEEVGFVGGDGDNSGCYKTNDGGNTWYNPTSIYPLNDIGDIAFSNDSTGFAILTFSGYMYTTVDQGETWELDETLFNNEFIRIKFFDNNVGFIIGRNIIFKTINGGSNWHEVPSGISGYPWFNDINFPTENIGYITMEDHETQVIKTTDGGETWFPIDFPCTATPTTVGFFNEDEGLVMGAGGMIFKTYTGGIVNVPEFPEDITNEANLICFPNPVKDILNLNLNLKNNNYPERLIIYDIFGRKIEDIENRGEQDNLELDVSHWEVGVYFVVSVYNGEIVSRGKFIKIH